jgi:hypothetical protein
VDDGDQSYSITLANATSADANYSGKFGSSVSASNTDDDTAGLTVTESNGSTLTTEGGGTDTFTVVLNSKPSANVTIALTSTNTAEGTVNPASLTFTAANWNTPKTVTLTGVNDSVADGNQTYSIILANATSSDPNYNNKFGTSVSATNTDDDTPGVTVTESNSSTLTTEGGSTDTFTVMLNTQPTADVTIAISSTNTAEGTVNPASLTFTSANWNTPQTVTLTGVDDSVKDGDQSYSITLANATSTDTRYNGLFGTSLSASNTDDDIPSITMSPTSGLVTTEAGGTATFTVALKTQPTADVTIPLSSDTPAEGTVSPASLTFTSANWNTPQTVTLTGVDDSATDGDQTYSITVGAATSTDADYNGLSASVSASNRDDDPPTAPTPIPAPALCSLPGFPASTQVALYLPNGNNGLNVCYSLITDPVQAGVTEQPFTLAAEVYTFDSSGSVTTGVTAQVCLQGEGTLLYRDASGQPRTTVSLPAFSQGGFTCGLIPHAGTIILIPGASAPAATIPPTSLSQCRVTTTHILNLRTEPDATSAVLDHIPYQTTLSASARSGEWLQVVFGSQQGWLSAAYLTFEGDCG